MLTALPQPIVNDGEEGALLAASPHPPAGGMLFGQSVALNQDGSLLIVGADARDFNATTTNSGRAFTYEWSVVGGWVNMFTIGPPFPQQGEEFGSSVAISSTGNMVVIGAEGSLSLSSGLFNLPADAAGAAAAQQDTAGSGVGAVYVFIRSGAIYEPVAYLKGARPSRECRRLLF